MARVTDNVAEARIDQALVARSLGANDRRAFEQLVRRHQGMVRAQLRRLLHGDHAASRRRHFCWRGENWISFVARPGSPRGYIVLLTPAFSRRVARSPCLPATTMK